MVRMQRGPRHKPKVIHVNRLKPFYGEVDTSWFQLQQKGENDQPTEVERLNERMEPNLLSQHGAGESPDPDTGQVEPLSQLSDGENPEPEAEETKLLSQTNYEGNPIDNSAVDPLKPSQDVVYPADRDHETEPQFNRSGRTKRKRKPPDRYGEWCY